VGVSRIAIVVALVGVAFAGAVPTSSAAGTIRSRTVVSQETLRPGVKLTHLRLEVQGASPKIDIYRVAWRAGDPHVRLRAVPLGDVDIAGDRIRGTTIRSWASGQSSYLTAVMNGDYSAYTNRYPWMRTAGMLVSRGRLIKAGWGGPAVGYLPDGRLLMGRPRASAVRLLLPTGHATIGAWEQLGGDALKRDQVAAFTTLGRRVTIRPGYVGALVDRGFLAGMLTGSRLYRNVHGAGMQERVRAFRLIRVPRDVGAAAWTMRRAGGCAELICRAGETAVVRTGTALLVARETTRVEAIAAKGLARVARMAAPAVRITTGSRKWAEVEDVMGGRPQLVRDGAAITTRPSLVNDWQWRCGGGCWRPALVQSYSGENWLVVSGGQSYNGLTMPQWAATLRALGAKNAMGFDNNGSTELYVPGRRPFAAGGWERTLPTATALYYTP
jgi:hypothetical protein